MLKWYKRIFILLHRTDFGVTLYLEDKKHSHGDEENGVPTKIKNRVSRINKKGINKTNLVLFSVLTLVDPVPKFHK
ncbi:hypothetical protein BpHYR1_026603 [Brachionus plicatilis]|uniref:Uncharacterized protein n=1 Tax=Brachionus plicatilis TaxID=10195 RepID=A0A3M7PJM2_BRAPC|nr:hypothetical protein BpHYR1_026603 [Brachionus plicatilis]